MMYKPDRDYFERKMDIVLRDLDNYTNEELWREVSRILTGATGMPSAEDLVKAQAADPIKEWYAVDEKLPNKKEMVLLYRDGEDYILPGYINDKGVFFALTADIGVSYHSGVTNWKEINSDSELTKLAEIQGAHNETSS